jgi:hypothetical protein
MDSLIKSSTLFEDTTVYRGVAMEKETLAKLVKDGGRIKDPGFQSFSTDPSRATAYSASPHTANAAIANPSNVVLRTEAKRGQNVLEVLDLNANDAEGEHIFGRGVGFRVRSSRTLADDATGINYTELTVEAIS